MTQNADQNKTSAIVLAVAYVGLLGASLAILSNWPDLATRTGRHLMAGALAIAALTVVEILICAIPLRKGEMWAHWAAVVPFIMLGIPIFVIDARFGPPRTRVATLLPQGIANLLGIVLVVRLLLRHFRKVS